MLFQTTPTITAYLLPNQCQLLLSSLLPLTTASTSHNPLQRLARLRDHTSQCMMILQCHKLQKCLPLYKSRKLQKRSDSSSSNLKISAKKHKKMPKNCFRSKNANKSKTHSPSNYKLGSSCSQLENLQPNSENRSKKRLNSREFKAPKLFPLIITLRSQFKRKTKQ